MTFAEQVQEAKKKIKIPEVWRLLGYPGEPKKSGKSPWRQEKNDSFSVFANGTMFKDFGDNTSGDVIIFIEKSCGISRADAMRKVVEMAFGTGTDLSKAEVLPTLEREVPLRHGRIKPEMPELRVGHDFEIEQLAQLRGLSVEAILHAQSAGLLWFGMWKGHAAWFVTDEARANGQARKMNGGLWRFRRPDNTTGEMKAWTIPHSWASWPIGIARLSKGKIGYFCEGGPDLVAACTYACTDENIVPIGMLGGSQPIHPSALPMFYKREMVFFMHNEAPKPRNVNGVMVTPEFSAGEEAALRWMEQLKPYTKRVRIYSFPDGVKDLNDYVKQYDRL